MRRGGPARIAAPLDLVLVVDHRKVLKLIAEGGQVVDVLPAHEHRTGAIRGSIHLPLPKLLHNAQHALDKNRPIAVYCRDCL